MDEENKEIKLDSPLVVHKKSDASYQDTAVEADMSVTHENEDSNAPTLQRHRFRREKKKNKGGIWFFIAVVVIAAAVISALFYSGKLPLSDDETTTQPVVTQETTENKFKNTIVIKGTYIFYEGVEIDNLRDLESKIKYLDEDQKNIIIVNEHAQNDFWNFEFLPLLEKCNVQYETKFSESTGLISQYETTTPTTTTTTALSTQPSEQATEPTGNVDTQE